MRPCASVERCRLSVDEGLTLRAPNVSGLSVRSVASRTIAAVGGASASFSASARRVRTLMTMNLGRTPSQIQRTNESEASASPIRLPTYVTIASLSAACRDAWRVFVEQSEEWRAPEHRLWSAGLYGPVERTVLSPQRECTMQSLEPRYRAAEPRFVERMIRTARARALQTLGSFAYPRSRLAFGARMRDAGEVSRCVDSFGNTGFVPTPATGALSDRIQSLIAADLLTRPGDFEGETLCSSCGGIVLRPSPCCARYEGRDTCIPSRIFESDVTSLLVAG